MIKQRFWSEVFEHGYYEPVRELGQKDTCIDLGACTGEFSIWTSPQFRRIYAIEGMAKLYKSLKENVSDFNNIKPLNIALGDWNGNGHMAGTTDGGAKLSLDRTPTDRDIKVMTLASFIHKYEIDSLDCLKVDIEEGEKQLFESEDFPTVAGRIKYIIGEHVAALSGLLLKNLGFSREDYTYGSIFRK